MENMESMESMESSDIKPLFVYVLTKGYVKPDDAQAGVILDMVLGPRDPETTDISPEDQARIRAALPEDVTGALLCSGHSLSHPGALADMLEKDSRSRLVVITEDEIIQFERGEDSEEYEALMPNLRQAAENGLDSWSCMDALIKALPAGKQ